MSGDLGTASTLAPAHLSRVIKTSGELYENSIGFGGTGLKIARFRLQMSDVVGCPDPDHLVLAWQRSDGAVWSQNEPSVRGRSSDCLTLNSVWQDECWNSENICKFDLIYIPKRAVADVLQVEFDRDLSLDDIRELRFEKDPLLNPAIRFMSAQLDGQQTVFDTELRSFEFLLASRFVRSRIIGKGSTAGASRLSSAAMRTISELAAEQLGDALSLNVLADAVGMDIYSFTRAFKATTGETPHRFVIGRRIDRAQQMLRHGTEPLADIAYACGFSSQAHMTSTFTKHAGISPGRYRKEVRS